MERYLGIVYHSKSKILFTFGDKNVFWRLSNENQTICPAEGSANDRVDGTIPEELLGQLCGKDTVARIKYEVGGDIYSSPARLAQFTIQAIKEIREKISENKNRRIEIPIKGKGYAIVMSLYDYIPGKGGKLLMGIQDTRFKDMMNAACGIDMMHVKKEMTEADAKKSAAAASAGPGNGRLKLEKKKA